jgi:hypothetical protein
MLHKDVEEGELANNDAIGISTSAREPGNSRGSRTPSNAGRRDPRFGYESIADSKIGVNMLGLASGIDANAIPEVSSESTRRRAHSPHMSSARKYNDTNGESRGAVPIIDDDSTFRKIRTLRMNLDDVMVSVFERLGFQRTGHCFVRYRRVDDRNIQTNAGINASSAPFTTAQTGQNTGDDWVIGPHYPGDDLYFT